jgi:hypothetical protein
MAGADSPPFPVSGPNIRTWAAVGVRQGRYWVSLSICSLASIQYAHACKAKVPTLGPSFRLVSNVFNTLGNLLLAQCQLQKRYRTRAFDRISLVR